MGVFEMIVLIVLITTIGKTVEGRRSRRHRIDLADDRPRLEPGEAEHIRQTLDELNGRVVRLEEERDFYKQLLESPERKAGLPPPEQPGG